MSNTVTLQSSDNQTFDVDLAVASESLAIKAMVEERGTDNAIRLPKVTSTILAKVIEYCKYHVRAQKLADDDNEAISEDQVKAWEAEFLTVDVSTLFRILLAAHYLNIKKLLDLTCQKVANMIKGKTPEEIRTTFNIKNDLTPEEDEELRGENQWALE